MQKELRKTLIVPLNSWNHLMLKCKIHQTMLVLIKALEKVSKTKQLQAKIKCHLLSQKLHLMRNRHQDMLEGNQLQLGKMEVSVKEETLLARRKIKTILHPLLKKNFAIFGLITNGLKL